jgi:dihydrofolate reductase
MEKRLERARLQASPNPPMEPRMLGWFAWSSLTSERYREGKSLRAQRIATSTRRPRWDAVRVGEVTDALVGAVAGVAVGSLWEPCVASCWRRIATHQFTEREPQMPELVIDFITSLDGYGAAEGWPGWWGLEGPEYLAWLADHPEADYTVLIGANTYRLMSGLASDGEPGTDILAGLSKVVFSTTLTEPLAWANTQLVTQDPVEAVREMKDKGTKSMRTLGSLTLCRSLLKAGLVDRFRVVVFPVITGATGRDRIYDGYPDVALDMVASRTFDGRLQLLEYVPTVLAGPPGTTKTDA